MKQTAETIIQTWLTKKVNLTHIERVLQLPFGSLKEIIDGRESLPEETTLLNMVNMFPFLLDVEFKIRRKKMKAKEILENATDHMGDRAVTYDNKAGERSMYKTITVFNALYGTSLTEEQGWAFMAVLKLVRTTQGAYRADNYEDMTAYSALMGEAASEKKIRKLWF